MSSVVSTTQYTDPEQTIGAFKTQSCPGKVCCMGGETKLTVPEGVHGVGGRNTHLALSMLTNLQEHEVFVSFASDGKDNSKAAGAIVDYSTVEKARVKGLAIETYAQSFDSYTLLAETNDLLVTSPLESNVADLMILLS